MLSGVAFKFIKPLTPSIPERETNKASLATKSKFSQPAVSLEVFSFLDPGKRGRSEGREWKERKRTRQQQQEEEEEEEECGVGRAVSGCHVAGRRNTSASLQKNSLFLLV